MAIETKPVLDGAGDAFDLSFANDGADNLSAAHVLLKADAVTAVNPATSDKQDTLAGLVATAANQSTANGTLASILSGLGAVVLAAGSAVIGKVALSLGGTDVSTSNRLPVAQADMLSFSGSATSATTLFTQDCTGYSSISVQVTSAGSSCTIVYEMSDDNTTFHPIVGAVLNGPTALPVTSTTTAIMLSFRVIGRYFRARVFTYGSGTVSVVGNLHRDPQAFTTRSTVDLPSTVAATALTTGAPVHALAKSANPTAVTDGQAVRPLATLAGAQVTQPYAIPAAKWHSGLITVTASDQALKASGGAGVKNTATWGVLNTDATWTANTVQVRDGTTVLFDIPLPAGAGYYLMPAGIELISSAATALNIKASGAVTGNCYANFGGHAVAD